MVADRGRLHLRRQAPKGASAPADCVRCAVVWHCDIVPEACTTADSPTFRRISYVSMQTDQTT